MLCLLLAGCLSPQGGLSPPRDAWAESLRALDPADAPTSAHDLTAAYLRLQGDSLQIRVDLLAFQDADDLSLEIKIGDELAPEADPLIIHIPASTDLARLSLDPGLATVTIEIPRSQVPARSRVDVTTPEDALTGLTPTGHLPTGNPQGMSLLLTFYDTFTARFPAEALRSWDGAHSGPRGERHGLKHLLDAVETYQVPIVLLDLKTPETLSALDAMGLLPRIQQMEGDGQLILPDREGQEPLFDLSPSPFSWGGIPFRPTFAFTSDPSHIYRPLFNQTTYIPVAAESNSSQPASDGASLEVRRVLLELALNEDENDLLVLGGSLRDTTWGSPDMVGKMLAWFASRPYIHVLSADDLLTFPAKSGIPEIRPLPRNESLAQLEAHYHRLTEPVLQFAKDWQGSPLSNCANDIDKDNQPECILANGQYLAVLDPQGGRLTYLFSVGQMGNSRALRQLIGPSWQVAVGLGNPSRWDLSKGEAADPGAYPGAFADADNPFETYQPAIAGDTLVFTSLDGTRIKTFRLTDSGIEVSYQVQEPATTQIPLLVEPGTRFTSGWVGMYRRDEGVDGIRWGLGSGPMVEVQAQGQVTMRAFNEPLPLLVGPEDPDFSYPASHYVPFPIAFVDVEVQAGSVLRLEEVIAREE